MHRWAERVLRVHHRGEAAGKERDLLPRLQLAAGPVHAPLRRRLQRLLRHFPIDHAEVDARLLEDVAISEHSSNSTSTTRSGVRLPAKLCSTIAVLDRLANVLLRFSHHRLEAAAHGVRSVRLIAQGGVLHLHGAPLPSALPTSCQQCSTGGCENHVVQANRPTSGNLPMCQARAARHRQLAYAGGRHPGHACCGGGRCKQQWHILLAQRHAGKPDVPTLIGPIH
mmetsp:Transcript_122590/g.291472  ORF Transcript_122590/g.291472 Transcript_122590/m.291472 type:complete len:225 (+) Transcript_122590:815-1489(+)